MRYINRPQVVYVRAEQVTNQHIVYVDMSEPGTPAIPFVPCQVVEIWEDGDDMGMMLEMLSEPFRFHMRVPKIDPLPTSDFYTAYALQTGVDVVDSHPTQIYTLADFERDNAFGRAEEAWEATNEWHCGVAF